MNAVDVVVPCYNYGRFLEECVYALLSQECVHVRVLVIDDASSDNTEQVGRRLASEDRRVEFRRHEVNRGNILTYNEGLLSWASADYSLLISADDLLLPRALSRAVRLMERHPEVGLTYGMAVQIWDGDNLEQVPVYETGQYQLIQPEKFLQYLFTQGNALTSSTAVVRTDVQQAIGGYSADLPHFADAEMWMRFAAHGPVGVLNATQSLYRWHGSNMSYVFRAETLRDGSEEELAFRRGIQHWGYPSTQTETWLKILYRRLATEAFWNASSAFDRKDPEACRRFLRYAETCDPEVRRSRQWLRLRAKMLQGPAMWSTVSRALDYVRGAKRSRTWWQPPQRHQTFGWWPEPSEGLGETTSADK